MLTPKHVLTNKKWYVSNLKTTTWTTTIVSGKTLGFPYSERVWSTMGKIVYQDLRCWALKVN